MEAKGAAPTKSAKKGAHCDRQTEWSRKRRRGLDRYQSDNKVFALRKLERKGARKEPAPHIMKEGNAGYARPQGLLAWRRNGLFFQLAARQLFDR